MKCLQLTVRFLLIASALAPLGCEQEPSPFSAGNASQNAPTDQGNPNTNAGNDQPAAPAMPVHMSPTPDPVASANPSPDTPMGRVDMSPDPFMLQLEWPRDPRPLEDPEVVACIARGMAFGTPEACAACTCQRCMPEADAVYGSADAAFAERAQALVSCGLRTCCAGASCYCQVTPDGSSVDLQSCGVEATGPCKAEVEAAAGIEGLVLIQSPCESQFDNACFAARQLGLCTTGDPIPLSGDPVIGACAAECQMCQM